MKDRVDVRDQIEENLENLNVIVTTYGLAKRKEDNKFLRHLKPVVCVFGLIFDSNLGIIMLTRWKTGMRVR